MIAVVDRSLSVVKPTGGPEAIRALMQKLFAAGANVLELSEEFYEAAERRLPRGKFIIRLPRSSDCAAYPEIQRFVSAGSYTGNVTVSEEYFIRDLQSIQVGNMPPLLRPVRLCVFTGAEGQDEERFYQLLRQVFLGYVEFCPIGKTGEATAAAAEWVLHDGNCVVTTVSGYGGYASFEEVTQFLHLVRRRRPEVKPQQYSEIRDALFEVSDADFSRVDECHLCIDRHSSCQVVKFKLDQMGYSVTAEKLKALTAAIHATKRTGSRSLTDGELLSLLKSI